MKKKAEIFTIERLTTILKEIGEEFGYKVDSNIEINLENTSTIKYFNEENTLLLSIIILYGRPIIQIDIFDKEKKNIFSEAIKENKYEMKTYRSIMDKVYLELGKNVKFLLNTPEKIYDYGEENNWQGLEQKHYEILSKDISLSQKAVADMQDKGLEIPETLKKFRRYSMSLKDIISSKIAKEKIATKKVASATKILKKKAAWSDAEKKQVGALDDNAVGKFNIYQDKAGEIFVTKHKLNDNFVLMDTAETFDDVQEKIEKDWQDTASYVGYDKELLNDKSIWQFADYEGDENGIVDLSKDYATEKKAATGYDYWGPKEMADEDEGTFIIRYYGGPGHIDYLRKSRNGKYHWVEQTHFDYINDKPFETTDYELAKKLVEQYGGEIEKKESKHINNKKKAAEEDLDVKLKVQKNKPVGLDTSSPKSLPESIRPLMQDLKGKMATLKETEAELADVKAGLDAKYQEAKNKSQIVEKQAEIENLTQNIGKLLFAAKNETFQFQDNLVALTHQTKVVPAKATDKWKFEKVFAKLQELMGDENAQKFLDATLNGLQSQATEKTITELNIFSPTQKQMKTSDTSDTNSFIDKLKEIYTNLRAYFLDVKKANNIIEEQLATGTTASKKSNVSKKAETNLVEGKWYRLKGFPYDIQFTGKITEEGKAIFQDSKYREISFDKDFEFIETNRVPMDEEGFKTLWDWAFTNKAVLRYTLNNMFPEDLIAFSKWMNENKTEEEIKAFNEKMPLDYLMKGSSKKANIDKKAENMVTMELPLANYMEMLKDRAKEIGRSLYMADELEDYFLAVGGNVLEPMTFVDNYLINGEFVEKKEFTADGNYSELYEEYNGNWEQMCKNEAVFYNDEEACLNLGV